MTNKITILINPTSNKKQNARAAAIAIPHLEQTGLRIRQLKKQTVDETYELAESVIHDNTNKLVVINNNNIMHLACQSLTKSNLPLDIIPANTNNDTARALKIDHKNPHHATNAIIANHLRRIDLADVADTQIATVVTTGFDTKVNERTNHITWPHGQIHYNVATVTELRVFEPIRFDLELDGQPYELDAILVSIGNSTSYNNSLRICENTEIDNNLLDVAIVKPINKTELIQIYPRLFNNSHIKHQQFEQHRVQNMSIAAPNIVTYNNGKRLGPLPLTITILPSALHVFAAKTPT